MAYIAILFIVCGQIPHPVVTVTKDGSMGLLINEIKSRILQS